MILSPLTSPQRLFAASYCRTSSSAGFETELGSGRFVSSNDVCQCLKVLDPFNTSAKYSLISPALMHYCRVCNIQLNSCKQVRIHCAGKKHQKRCNFFMFSMETNQMFLNEARKPDSFCYQQQNNQSPFAIPFTAGTPPSTTTRTPQQQQQQPFPTLQPVIYAFQPSPIDANNPPYVQVTQAASDLLPPNSQVQKKPKEKKPKQKQNTLLLKNPMSPSLTSGFSGSGPDCKSTETSSVLSTNSCSSFSKQIPSNDNKKEKHGIKLKNASAQSPTRPVQKSVLASKQGFISKSEIYYCELCQVSVNSQRQVQAHLSGSRHRLQCLRLGVMPMVTPSPAPPSRNKSSYAACPNVLSPDTRTGRPQNSLLGEPPLDLALLAKLNLMRPMIGLIAPTSQGSNQDMCHERLRGGKHIKAKPDAKKKGKTKVPNLNKDSKSKADRKKAEDKTEHTSSPSPPRELPYTVWQSENGEQPEPLIQSSPMLNMFLQTLEPHKYFEDDNNEQRQQQTSSSSEQESEEEGKKEDPSKTSGTKCETDPNEPEETLEETEIDAKDPGESDKQ